MIHRLSVLGAVLSLAAICPVVAPAQSVPLNPSPAITRILDAPATPQVLISPDRSKLLILEPAVLPSRASLSQAETTQLGIRINPRNSAPIGLPTYSALVARPIGRGETRRIVIPWNARVVHAGWSPDGQRIAYSVVEEAGISLWVADPANGDSRMLLGPSLNGSLGGPCQWFTGSDRLLCRKRTGAEPSLQSQLTIIDLNGSEQILGAVGVYTRAEPSPDGRYLLVETLISPNGGAPASGAEVQSRPTLRSEVWDQSGGVLKVVAGRAVQWRDDAAATLVWVESQSAKGPADTTSSGDRMFQLEAPFTGAPLIILDVTGRIQETIWGRGNLAMVTEGAALTGEVRTWIINPSVIGGAPELLSKRTADDRWADPRRFLLGPGTRGRLVLQTSKDGGSAFLAGVGPSSKGERPYLDRLDLKSHRRLRIWQAEGSTYETVVALLDPSSDHVVTRRETPAEPPNYFIRDLSRTAPGRLTALTEFKDPSPEFSKVTRQLITFRRADGVQLSATLYLPAGYTPAQGRLPFVLWATPREFRSASTASEINGSPYRFLSPGNTPWLHLLESGCGVLDASAIPIIAEGASPAGDRYREQLIDGAWAAVNKVVVMGVADPKRIGVGSDESGGTAAATLLAHSGLFRAGITVAVAEADSSGSMLLVRPPDANNRPLLTLLSLGGGMPTREAVAQRLAEITNFLDKYLRGAGPLPGRP